MLNSNEVKTLRTLFAKMSNEDLSLVVTLHKAAHSARQSNIASQFIPRDTVSFTDRRGDVVIGIIEKVNRKTIKVRQSSNRMLWTVSPSLLTKV